MSFPSSRPAPAIPPPSPTSPPESGLLKRRRLSSDRFPRSPVSPSLMSVATKSYVPSAYGNAQHADEDEGSARSSPRSPRRPQQQPPSRPTHSLPTPAHSVTGIPGLDMLEDVDQHRDKRPRLDGAGGDDEQIKVEEESTRATNHDRQDEMETDDIKPDPILSARAVETTLEQLQKDMGEAFLLCRSKVERQRPDPQQHLLALYGLGPLLRSVARTDPKTGEKINKLRKSYEGQIKSFGLAGRNKPVKGERNMDEDQPGPLRRMAGSSAWGLQPDEAWDEQHAKTKIQVTPDFAAKLKQAVQMQPGTVRNNAHWEDVLGFDKPGVKPLLPLQPVATQPAPTTRVANGVVRPPTTSQPSAPTAEAKRQTRGKKRSYGDDSFVGYGEGYSEPEDGGDGDDYGPRKRKKDPVGTTPMTYGQYNAGR